MSKLLLLWLAVPSAHAVPESYPLARLEGAAVFLRHAADSGNAACGLASSEALLLTQPLKALRDEALARERKALKRTPAFLKALRACERDCSCGAYSDLLEGVAGWEKEAAGATRKAAKFGAAGIAKCAKKEAVWFCRSALLGRLRKDARP